jgi:DnaJ homolog subfamily C member 8
MVCCYLHLFICMWTILQIAEEEVRAKEEHKSDKQVAKRKAQHEKAWEKSRDSRVGDWRDFMTKKSKKSKGGSSALGGYKPPKGKTNDEDKLYVQRPVGEQHRPQTGKR